MPRCKSIAITGSFGSGKSTVLGFFRDLGAETLSCDDVVHELYRKEPIKELIKRHFGPRYVTKTGIDRAALGRVIFSDKEKRKALEALVHPFVFEEIRRFLARDGRIKCIEVPLLFETSSEEIFDCVVVVKAEEDVIIKRLKQKGYSLKEIKERLKSQKPLDEKIQKADFVIDNSSGIEETRKQVLEVWREINEERA